MSESDNGPDSEGYQSFHADDSEPLDIGSQSRNDVQSNLSQPSSSTGTSSHSSQIIEATNNDSHTGNDREKATCDDIFTSSEEDTSSQEYIPSQEVTDGLQGSQNALQNFTEDD
jgi:hypothetical protein